MVFKWHLFFEWFNFHLISIFNHVKTTHVNQMEEFYVSAKPLRNPCKPAVGSSGACIFATRA